MPKRAKKCHVDAGYKDIDSVYLSVNVEPTESVAVMLTVNVPMPRETPVITPALLSFIPGGKLPPVIANVMGPVPPSLWTETSKSTPINDPGRLVVVIRTGGLMVMLKVFVTLAPAAS